MQRWPPEDHSAWLDFLGRDWKFAWFRPVNLAVQLQVQFDGRHVRRGFRGLIAKQRHSVRETRARRHWSHSLRRNHACFWTRPPRTCQVVKFSFRIRFRILTQFADQPESTQDGGWVLWAPKTLLPQCVRCQISDEIMQKSQGRIARGRQRTWGPAHW